nr:hypothetical transcript [Hymenolepis microstoma]
MWERLLESNVCPACVSISAGSFSVDLLGLSFDDPSKAAHPSGVAASSELMSSGNGEKRLTTKESILALYNLSKPAPTVQAPSVAETNRNDLLFPPFIQPNGQNGNARAAHPLFAAPATPGQVQSPPTYQPSALQPPTTTSSNFSWSSLRQQQQSQPAPRAHPPSIDLFDNMDVFQSAGSVCAAKPVSQWDNAFSSGVNQPTISAPFSFQTPSQPQPQWPPSATFQQTPVATTVATNLSPPAQHSYLAQIQKKSEPISIGRLQHEMKMLSIKVLEKDIEIRNLKAQAATNNHSNSSKVRDISSVQAQSKTNSSIQRIELEKLRQFLIEHEFSNPCHTFITREVYNRLNQASKRQLSLIELIKFRHFQLCDSLQYSIKSQLKAAKSSNDTSVQTEEFGFDDISFEKQMHAWKQNNEYLTNQLAILEEKSHSLKQANGRLKEELKSLENERTCLLERTIRAEERQQAMEEEQKKFKQSYESGLPLSVFEQFRALEVSRAEQQTSELKKDFAKLQVERDDLIQRLHTLEVEKKRLREDLHSVCSGAFSSQPSDVLTKTRVISLELQLNAANVAKTDALRQIGQLTEKFEAASRTIYELEADRKVEVSRLEAQLSMVSQKLAAYERLEVELDRAIERFVPNKGDNANDVTDELFYLANVRDRNGNPLLATLASRRLEHCIELAHRTAKAEEAKRKLQSENEELKNELEMVKDDAKRQSDLYANMDKPTNSLAAALVERNKEISNLQSENRKLEEKLRQLYDCTKDILIERDAILADLKEVYTQVNPQKTKQEPTQIGKILPRKICKTET